MVASPHAVDLQALGVPPPHFLRRAELLDGGRTLVGEVFFPSSYEAIGARHSRVNIAESLHAAWNAAHVIANALGGGELRARRVTITPGRRPIPADSPLQLVAHVHNVIDRERDYAGKYNAELRDGHSRTLFRADVDFWARKHQEGRPSNLISD